MQSRVQRPLVLGQRPLALDDAGRDVMGDRLDDLGDLVGFRQHLAAEPRVLHETIAPLVARHRHMRDGVEPKPRRIAPADAAVEQVDVRRRFVEQRIERIVEQFEPRHLGVAEIDDHARLFGDLDAGFADSVLQDARLRVSGAFACAALRIRPHMGGNLAAAGGRRKPYKLLFPLAFRRGKSA